MRLASPQGDFVVPDPPPEKMLMLVGGSGITPIMSILRTLDRRGSIPDVVLAYSAAQRGRHDVRPRAARAGAALPSFTFYERFTDADGMLTADQLDDVCPDWRERETWACGPGADARRVQRALRDARPRPSQHPRRALHPHRPKAAATAARCDVTFGVGGPTVEVDGATTLLEAGEKAGVNMLFGCRMGICHTCDVPLASGRVRDLRSGDEHGEPNEYIQTCISVAAGDCTLSL